MIMFFPSTYPGRAGLVGMRLKLVELAERLLVLRYPIRWTFFGCCASAVTATASSTTTNRIDKTPAFFIAHIIRYVSRGTVLEETEIYDGRRQYSSSGKTRFLA